MASRPVLRLCSTAAALLAPVGGAAVKSAAHAKALFDDSACPSGQEACSLELLQNAARRGRRPGWDTDADTCTDSCGAGVKAYNYARPNVWALDSNVICFTGPRQSPININEKDTVEALSSIFVPMYQPVRDAAVLNTGHNLQVPGEFGFTLANDMKKWQAEQYHIHAPSEHFFEGKSFPLELHLVHTVGKEFSFRELDDFSLLSAGSRLKGNMSGRVPLEHGANRTKRFDLYNATVVGILFELGLTTNPCIGALLNPTVPGESCQRCLPHPVDLMRCFKRELSGPYYYYSGSFTTPPCTEDTQWYVMRKRATITAVDLDRFKTLAFPEPQNARPIQPRNGRVIYRV